MVGGTDPVRGIATRYKKTPNRSVIQITKEEKMCGGLGRLFQRAHGDMYIFKHMGVPYTEELVHALQQEKLLLEEREEKGMKLMHFHCLIEDAVGEDVILLELSVRACGLRKGWSQLGNQVDPTRAQGYFGVQMLLRHDGVSHL
eukprot:augustus_masked-scaffold_1-processed-gene-32.64-mRNA-1 protein AED:1.00 eAED:1.00 QI:0/0/0/0/1/1/2/0/143